MKHRKARGSLTGVCLAGLALVMPLSSRAGSALAVEMGCYNCHGTPTRADAPGFDRLAAKFEKRRGDTAAEQHALDEFRRAGVQLHERVTDDTARQLVRWLFNGAK